MHPATTSRSPSAGALPRVLSIAARTTQLRARRRLLADGDPVRTSSRPQFADNSGQGMREPRPPSSCRCWWWWASASPDARRAAAPTRGGGGRHHRVEQLGLAAGDELQPVGAVARRRGPGRASGRGEARRVEPHHGEPGGLYQAVEGDRVREAGHVRHALREVGGPVARVAVEERAPVGDRVVHRRGMVVHDERRPRGQGHLEQGLVGRSQRGKQRGGHRWRRAERIGRRHGAGLV